MACTRAYVCISSSLQAELSVCEVDDSGYWDAVCKPRLSAFSWLTHRISSPLSPLPPPPPSVSSNRDSRHESAEYNENSFRRKDGLLEDYWLSTPARPRASRISRDKPDEERENFRFLVWTPEWVCALASYATPIPERRRGSGSLSVEQMACRFFDANHDASRLPISFCFIKDTFSFIKKKTLPRKNSFLLEDRRRVTRRAGWKHGEHVAYHEEDVLDCYVLQIISIALICTRVARFQEILYTRCKINFPLLAVGSISCI